MRPPLPPYWRRTVAHKDTDDSHNSSSNHSSHHDGPEYAQDTGRMVAPFTVDDYSLLRALPEQIRTLSASTEKSIQALSDIVQQSTAATRAETATMHLNIAELKRGVDLANDRIDDSNEHLRKAREDIKASDSRTARWIFAGAAAGSTATFMVALGWALFTNWDKVKLLLHA